MSESDDSPVSYSELFANTLWITSGVYGCWVLSGKTTDYILGPKGKKSRGHCVSVDCNHCGKEVSAPLDEVLSKAAVQIRSSKEVSAPAAAAPLEDKGKASSN